jgi:uncharacterized membrane protein
LTADRRACHGRDVNAPSSTRGLRLAPIDWLRGLVMVLMTVDHASGAFNAGRLFTDAAFAYTPGSALPTSQFLTRWMTHLCAPTFVFLAGTSIALMGARRVAAGDTPASVDRRLLVRGLFIALLDPLWMSLGFFGWSRILFQVLYAIGLSMMCMALLRRLPAALLAALAIALLVSADAILGPQLGAGGQNRGGPPLIVGLLLAGGRYGLLIIGYPLASWLAIMMLGHAYGQVIHRRGGRIPVAATALVGLGLLALFAVLRLENGFGNMALLRYDDSLVQWLHVAKYPPSLTYCGLELGLMCLLLAAFAVIGRGAEPTWLRPLRLLGSTAMFFYLLHVHLLELAAVALGMRSKLGLGATYLSAALCVLVLYPACARYARYKASHANWITALV